jgi:hypothetical protein
MSKWAWNLLVQAINSIHDCPIWIKEQSCLSYTEIIRLPQLDDTSKECDMLPSIDEQLVEADYLEFLREQIRIDARGPEWIQLLKTRLTALEPFLQKTLIRVILHRKPHRATLYINPENGELIHFEID